MVTNNVVDNSGMQPVRILADMDTGIDDTLALCLLMALQRAGRVQLLGCVGTYGNVSATDAMRNSRTVLDACGGTEIPVYAGLAAPRWAQGFAVDTGCARFHGANGLGNVRWESARAQSAANSRSRANTSANSSANMYADTSATMTAVQAIESSQVAVLSLGGERVQPDDSRLTHRQIQYQTDMQSWTAYASEQCGFAVHNGVQAIIDTVRRYGEQVTILATGPLTDIAEALEQAPDIAQQMKLVLMGGSLTQEGNCYDLICETNIFQDPESADFVFHSGASVTMVGLDVTHQCLLTREHMRAFADAGSKLGKMLAQTLKFYIEANEASDPLFTQGSPLHDPLAALVAVDPSIVTCLPLGMKVETRTGVGAGFRGRTIGDPAQVRNAHPRTQVAVQVDAQHAVDEIIDAVLGLCRVVK